MRKRSGFTLIELLVVVAIITLLVSILMPSLRGTRDWAKQVYCAHNMRTLGLTFQMYAADNEDWIPRNRCFQNPQNLNYGEFGTNEWFQFAYPYLKGTPVTPPDLVPNWEISRLFELGKELPVFDCPVTDITRHYPNGKWFDHMLVMQDGDTPLGDWDSLNYLPTYEKLSDADADDTFLIEHDDDLPWHGYGLPGDLATWNAAYACREFFAYRPGYHHNGGVNILFADGNVEWHTQMDYQPYSDDIWQPLAYLMKLNIYRDY